MNECEAATRVQLGITLSCNQNCTNTEGSYACSCRPGFTLSVDGHTCLPNPNMCLVSGGNPCDSSNSICQYSAVNNKTKCDCNNGFENDNGDETICKGQ